MLLISCSFAVQLLNLSVVCNPTFCVMGTFYLNDTGKYFLYESTITYMSSLGNSVTEMNFPQGRTVVPTQTSVRVHLARMEQPARMLSMATAAPV